MQPDVAATLKGLMERDRLVGGVLQVDDCRATYEESPPTDRFYGMEAVQHDAGHAGEMM